MQYETDAWILSAAGGGLRRETISFDLGPRDVLAEPLYGCWEANMAHALARHPVDICRERGEERVVIGNAGVVRVLRAGSEVRGLREGDVGMVFAAGIADAQGYMSKVLGYDAPGTL